MKTSSLIKKTKAHLAVVNSQNRAPIFFLDQLNTLGLAPTLQSISKDLDFTERAYVVVSVDVRSLSKTRLDFLLSVFNSSVFRKTGLLRVRIASFFSLKGRLHFNFSGLSGFDGSLLLVLTYVDYSAALLPFPTLLQSDFFDEEEFKEWSSLIESCIPLFVSFKGSVFPFDFFKENFSDFERPSETIPSHLILKAALHITKPFWFSFLSLSKTSKAALTRPLLPCAASSAALRTIFVSFINYHLCQR